MTNRKIILQDPVCGLIIDSENTEYSVVFNGKRMFFCSKECMMKFLKDPDKYLGMIHLHGIYPLQ